MAFPLGFTSFASETVYTPSILLKLSSFTSINMRAIVLLCLLHAAFGQDKPFSWNGPVRTGPNADPDQSSACLVDQASCGCCLMQKQVQRMEWFFNITHEEMKKELTKSKMALDNMRASRSAFSVALNNDKSLNCYGPFTNDKLIVYKHAFINLGDGYNVQTGIFTVPRSGVYSLTVTIYATGSTLATCANLQVNGQVVSALLEQNGQDLEDSATVVVAMKLKAGDQVAVNLPKGCFVCDNSSHYNTFTGFLLYATD
ncbi:complement C1q-like protein 2 [Siniperca chuatsi]|uniref:complement C1q-like protein 2 n=1 Tax=Siniperca chuatsi TaxID=119488 RepID=UPI001CE1EFC9|nr:complement C1q-like protein 2 [Siniperca chuatsi]